jgi:hypothetical protein
MNRRVAESDLSVDSPSATDLGTGHPHAQSSYQGAQGTRTVTASLPHDNP